MKNPYDEHGAHPDETHLGHHWFAWGAVIALLLLTTVPPVWRNAYEVYRGDEGSVPMVELFRYNRAKDGPLFDHLRAVESQFEDAAFTEPPRRELQAVLTAGLREGNRKTVIGRDGWLFFKPAIDGLTGFGPLKPEPHTVAKDPTREPWSGPLGAIVHFGDQLEEFGVELVLVPIPVKPMIYPEMVGFGGARNEALAHPDAAKFYDELRESGVQVLDLSADWMALKKEGTQVFLKQDTHWTPAGMQASAAKVAEYLKGRPWFGQIQTEGGKFTTGESRDLASEGDLVEKLDLPERSGAFADEIAKSVATVLGADGQPVSIYDTASPVVLLGDSFTNIFSDEKMGWGADAGFAQHLTKELGMTIDTIAQNGQASTGVRRTLASRPGAAAAMKERKKVVVWVIAARDLFLSETPAREAMVRWDDVEFSTTVMAGGAAKEVAVESPKVAASEPVKLRATITMKSSFADPKDVAYPDALYSCEYQVEEVLQGSFEAMHVLVYHWAFRERKLVPSSHYQEGDERLLTVVPFAEKTDLQSVNQANDSFDPDMPVLWAEEEIEPGVEAGIESGSSAPASANANASGLGAAQRAGLVAGGYAAVLILLLVIVARGCARRRQLAA